jgi:hypothetical protein
MNSKTRGFLLVAGAFAVAIILFFVLRGVSGSDSGSNTTTAAEKADANGLVIKLKGGEPVGGPKTLRYSKGEQVTFIVIPDGSEEEIHVHGYEIAKEADGTKPLKFSFAADLEGSYEIEAHSTSGSAALVATLEVSPG